MEVFHICSTVQMMNEIAFSLEEINENIRQLRQETIVHEIQNKSNEIKQNQVNPNYPGKQTVKVNPKK